MVIHGEGFELFKMNKIIGAEYDRPNTEHLQP